MQIARCYQVLLAGLLFLCMAVPSVFANPKGESEIALLTNLFPQNCHFSGQFLQKKNVEGLPIPLHSTGDFFFSCDLGLIWHTQEPFREAILYVNSSNNFRVHEDGSLTPLTGVTRYIMSNVFVKLLKGDTQYFVDEFAIKLADDNTSVELKPESDFMKKGIDSIRFQKNDSDELGITLLVDVTDVTGQVTHVSIDKIRAYQIEGKRGAFEQCEKLYSDNSAWCQVLRSPAHIRR
ncbi:outer membrane lipoprotein carrier protein LolA [Alteromonas ponticola]|uniref:Outer membrane lipoprotein carrier protein LolA n=1 Tax=Alteromonas aquimaris TaxID=2998417 RepID=A0ABT3P824_9ALTE|nr:outer membrane lipoprotein carrier protein LolA [Alteromonas aquimaris]MCW8108918.1 outer membrane lipoprotein carrier protein LolA [Alteromonas aquimaris]